MKTVLVFGNTDVAQDSAAQKVGGLLEGCKVVVCNRPDDVLSYVDEDFYILDVVKGLKEVSLIDDIDKFCETRTVTAHDFDLSTFLKILKETGEISDVKIIGIPSDADVPDALEKVKEILD